MESLVQKRVRVRRIIAILKKTHPDARLALTFSNPLELLIALILAAQARDELVNAVTTALFQRYRTASDWASADAEELQDQLGQINFYRTKTRAIQGACQTLLARFGGRVPDRLEDLLSLPGVGRKTANIILGNAFRKPAIGVDTHVGRVSERLGLTEHEDPDHIEADLAQMVPRKDAVKFCHLVQFHGRRVCVARKPDCPLCPVRSLCFYPAKTRP